MAGLKSDRAAKIRARATGPMQDATHLSRHFAMLDAELGGRSVGHRIDAGEPDAPRSIAGLLVFTLLVFAATLGFLMYQNGAFDDWFVDMGAPVPASAPWIKANGPRADDAADAEPAEPMPDAHSAVDNARTGSAANDRNSASE